MQHRRLPFASPVLLCLLPACARLTATPVLPPADPTSPAAASSQSALIQADIVELAARPDELLDTTEVRRRLPAGGTLEQGLESLREFGTVRVLARPAILAEWPQEATVSIGEQMPVQITVTPDDAGQSQPKTIAEDLGIRFMVRGHWLNGSRPTRAEISLNMRQSGIKSPSDPVLPPKGMWVPSITSQTWEYTACVTSGRSSWLVSDGALRDQTTCGLGSGRMCLTLIRLTVQRAP